MRIHCAQVGSDYRVDVSDDGIGMPEKPGDSLGLEIVNALVRDDLHGTLAFTGRTGGGTHASVQIPRPPQAEMD